MNKDMNVPMSKLAEPTTSSGLPAGIALIAFAVALFLFAWLGQPRDFAPAHWYAMLTVEGVTTYTDYPSEKACTDAEGGAHPACFSGAEFRP